MTNNIKFVITRFVFVQAQNAPKSVFSRGSAPDPAGGAYDASPDPLIGWGGDALFPFPSPLDAFGVSNSAPIYGASVLRPPQHKILATPVFSRTIKRCQIEWILRHHFLSIAISPIWRPGGRLHSMTAFSSFRINRNDE